MEPSRPKEQTTYNYPFAAAPDIIRSHQKDVYFEGILLNHLSTLLRRFYGARFIHTYTNEARTFSELLYLSLTTLLGNRTLGEEYCDIIQVEDDTLSLPSVGRRAGYIVTAILLPYSLNKVLPSFRSRIRAKLESNLGRLSRIKQQESWVYKFQNYLLEHLSTITSPSPVHALTITIFYFSGAYYQLSKRVFGLRYIFTKRVGESEARVGYEVLGVLLVVQIAVHTWLHVHSTLSNASIANQNEIVGGTAMIDGGVEVSLDPNSYSSNQELLLDNPIAPSSAGIAKRTNTKILPGPRYDLREAENVLGYIQGQNRKCTLCLEGLKDPSAPPCGHIFCWECIRDWVMEKPGVPTM